MMSNMLMVGLAACGLYLLFHLWYGGRGKPLTADEVEHYMQILDGLTADKEGRHLLGSLRAVALVYACLDCRLPALSQAGVMLGTRSASPRW